MNLSAIAITALAAAVILSSNGGAVVVTDPDALFTLNISEADLDLDQASLDEIFSSLQELNNGIA